jgi:hypothetical protein
MLYSTKHWVLGRYLRRTLAGYLRNELPAIAQGVPPFHEGLPKPQKTRFAPALEGVVIVTKEANWFAVCASMTYRAVAREQRNFRIHRLQGCTSAQARRLADCSG